MFELIVRLVVAASGLAVAFQDQPLFRSLWPVIGGFAAYSALVYWLENQGKRNKGIAGFVAVFDALFIATSLSQAGLLNQYGFLVLIPLMWATGRFGAEPANMAPLIAAAVMVAANFFTGEGFTLPILLHTGGILAIGLLTSHKRVIVKETTVEVPITNEVPVASQEAKDSIKSLKSHIADLERSTRKERASVRLWSSLQESSGPIYHSLCTKIAELCDAEGSALFSYNPVQKCFVFESASGTVPKEVRGASFPLDLNLSEGQIRHKLEQSLLAMRDPDKLVQCGAQLLKSGGKYQGLICLFHSRVLLLDDALRSAEDLADTTAKLMQQEDQRRDEQRRLQESELLYSVASISLGAETQQSLIARVCRELGETIKLDHLAIWLIDGEPIKVSSLGAQNRLLEDISFGESVGFEGWEQAGYPETIIANSHNATNIDKIAAIKQRVGSYALIPLNSGDKTLGFITASTHRTSGIEEGALSTMRVIGQELAFSLARLKNPGAHPEGVMTPEEFYASVRAGRQGFFVYLEVIRKEDLVEKFGQPSVDLAVRRLVRKIRSSLPKNSGICRREEGDYVAFLALDSQAAADSWANEALALASLIPLTTADGRAKIPLALKSKVAQIAQQKHVFSTKEAA